MFFMEDLLKKGIKLKILVLVIALVFCCLVNALAIEITELTNKVAFLKGGEICIADQRGTRIGQITEIAGKVEEFIFSPSLQYLAYSKIIKYVDEPGLWEEGDEIPQRSLCSIVIMDLGPNKILKEIMPPEDNWIYFVKWLPGNKLLYYGASVFDVWGFFEYDINNGAEKEIDYNKGSILLEADFYGDGFLQAYVDDSGLGETYRQNLHLVDLQSNNDRILVSKRSVLEPRISADKNNIAFMEVVNAGKKGTDILWVCEISDKSLKKLYEGPARAKIGGASELSWSFGGQYIGMFFSPEAVVIEVQNPGNIHKIQGTNFNWIENRKVLFNQGSDSYLYDLTTNKIELFIKDASKPVFLRKHN